MPMATVKRAALHAMRTARRERRAMPVALFLTGFTENPKKGKMIEQLYCKFHCQGVPFREFTQRQWWGSSGRGSRENGHSNVALFR